MVFNILDKKIRNAFSDAAMQYDMLTSLHKEIGRELTKKIMNHTPCETILDIGMGTGWYTRRLTQFFPDSQIVGLDFSHGMIECAQQKERTFKIVMGDAAQLPFQEGSFDIITSNLAYQWVGNLSQAYKFCHLRLKRSGLFCFTMFGRNTFCELFDALKNSMRDEKIEGSLPIARLPDDQKVSEALNDAGFHIISVSKENIKVRFADMISLIKWVKNIGASALPKNMYLGKDLLLRANDYYNLHFQDRLGVYATFEVIWVEAKK